MTFEIQSHDQFSKTVECIECYFFTSAYWFGLHRSEQKEITYPTRL